MPHHVVETAAIFGLHARIAGRAAGGVFQGIGGFSVATERAIDEAERLVGLDVLRRALANAEVGAGGFTIQPPARDFTGRIWQGVFSGPGAAYAAAGGSNLLLNRATYGYDAPTDEVQRPWADEFRARWTLPHEPRIGLSRFIFPAKDKRTAIQQIGPAVVRAAERMVARGAFPPGLGTEGYLRKFHCFYGHPDEIVAELQQEKVLPVATDLITQFNPAVPDQDAALRALELIATEIAPALGWTRSPQPELTGV